jgi:hypothetical protein
MTKTAVRFVITGPVNVDFDDDEVLDVRLTPWRKCEVQPSQKKPPYLFEPGSEWWTLQVDIFHRYSDTEAKITQIVNDEAEMTVYYAYAEYTTTKSLTCILDPEEITESYAWGEREAGIVTQLTFLQSS